MRFLLNTRRDDAGTRVCIHDLRARLVERGLEATLNDWSNYAHYDVVVFMGYDHDMERARRINSGIKIVLADPKLARSDYISAARGADLLLVSSVEQRDSFLKLNQNVLIYYMFPDLSMKPKLHSNAGKLVIAYHGNRVHLEAMRHSVLPAIAALAKARPLEFHAVYNIAHLGRSDLSLLDKCGVAAKHVQWDPLTLVDCLNAADIGVMPNELPIRERQLALAATAYSVGEFAYEPFDHLVRYKASANPGRLYPFVCAGVPIIADFSPSASQFMQDGRGGFIVSSPHGWYYALSRLAESPALRQSCADRLFRELSEQYYRQFDDFIAACGDTERRLTPLINGVATAEEEQESFYKYSRPNETLPRWAMRQFNRFRSFR